MQTSGCCTFWPLVAEPNHARLLHITLCLVEVVGELRRLQSNGTATSFRSLAKVERLLADRHIRLAHGIWNLILLLLESL